ncbi:MAG TPA: methyltransferase [Myxococcales bacterium]|nr:methyltransferase [Myxococcales bacterium]
MHVAIQPGNPLERLAQWLNLGPVPLAQAFLGMMSARAVMAGARLGIYAALAGDELGGAELAVRLGANAEGLRLLLDSLCAQDVLQFRADRYSLARRARPWLDPASPRSVADFLAFNYTQWEWWGSLEEAVRTGKGPAIHDYPPDDPRWDEYMRAMFQLARLVEPEISPRIRLPASATRLLDLGGGHGWFSACLCDRYPGLEATVIDLPGAARAGGRVLESAGRAARVHHVVGDARTAELGTGAGGVLIFQLLHHLSPDESLQLLRRARAALQPGGVLAVLELFRPERATRRDAAPLLGLHYFLTSSAAAYPRQEVERWIRDAGFSQPRVHVIRRLPLESLLVARAD